MKLLDYSGLQRFLNKIKTLLDSKANTGHTHSTSDVTDLLSDQHTWSSQQSYNADLNLNYSSTDVDDIIDTLAGSYTAEDFLAQNNVWTGNNTFSKEVTLTKVNAPSLKYQNSRAELGETNLSGDTYTQISFEDKNGDNFGYLRQTYGADGNNGFHFFVRNKFLNGVPDTTGTVDYSYFGLRLSPDRSKEAVFKANLRPYDSTNAYNLGDATYQWNNLYAKNYFYNGTQWGLDKANEWTGINTYTTALRFSATNYSAGTPSSDIFYGSLQWGGIVNNSFVQSFGINNAIRTNGTNDISLRVWSQTGSTLRGVAIETNADASNSSLRPLVNNVTDLGSTVYQWNSIYAKAYYYNGTAFGDIVTHDASEFSVSGHTHTKSQITDFPTKTSQFTNDSHQTITVGTDTTSTVAPAHSGTFTCIDSVTRDSNGHVTAVNTKTVTLPADNNTDTLVTQNVSTANENHPVLLTVTKDATANQGAKTSIFASGVKVNPSTNTVTATTFSGALSGNASSATQFSANKAVTLTGDVTGTASSKAGWSVATTLANSGVTAGSYGPTADVTGNNNATISVPQITVDAKGRVTSVTNRTLTCKNNTYRVYNKTLTIQKNGTNVATFTSNSNTDVTANITVPTKTSELTNDSGFLTSHQSLSNYLTKTTNVSEMGRYIDLHYDNATSAYDHDVRLYVSAQGTAAGKGTFAVTAAATILNHKLTLLDFIYNKNSTLVKGTQPTSTLYTGMYLCDKNGTDYKNNALGLLENSVDKNNLVSTYIRAIKNEAKSQVACEIAARVDASGNAYTYAPTPATADNSTKIATTAFVKAQGYLTSHQSLSNYSTLANTVKSLSISGKTITVTPGSGNAYTLTTQDTVYTHPTTAGNKHIPSGGSSGQILKYSASGTAVWADASFTRQMVSIDTDSLNGASLNSRTRTVTLTKSQLAVVTVDLTTLADYLVKLTATNVFVVAIHTLVGTNTYKQDSVNYGNILQQGATGRTRVVALIYPYNTSVVFTLAKVSGDGAADLSSYTVTVYQ